MRSTASKTFIGNTALMSSLSCDSVTAGAFFPQPDSHVPEEEVSQHTGQHMMSPPGKLPHLVMIHSQIRFGFLKALLDSPADPCEPDESFQARGSAGVRDEVGISSPLPKTSANDQPNRPVGFSIFGQNDTALHELIDYRSFRPFGNHPAIPEVIVRSPGDLLKSDGLFFSFRKNAFCSPLSAVPVGLLQNRRCHPAQQSDLIFSQSFDILQRDYTMGNTDRSAYI